MRFVPVIVFFIYVYLEVSFFVVVANSIGVLLALVCIAVTSVLGFSLVKSQGLKNLMIMQQKITNNENPTNEIIKSASLLMAGFFLLIPGFLTDILGIILLFPPVQQVCIKFIVSKITINSRFTSKYQPYQANDVIEGEFKRKNDE